MDATGVNATTHKLRDDVSQLGRSLNMRTEELMRPVMQMVEKRPIAAVGAAFAVGFVLAGGLVSRVTAGLLGMGMKMGTRFGVSTMLASFIEGIARELPGNAGVSGSTTAAGTTETSGTNPNNTRIG